MQHLFSFSFQSKSKPEQKPSKMFRFSLIFFLVFVAMARSKDQNPRIVTYEEVKDLPNHPEKLLVDVRDPNELLETGRIPTSINIPLKDLLKAFSSETSADDFKKIYGVNKPDADKEIIFSCGTGIRALKGADAVAELGYNNTRVYKGSWKEWAEREGLNQKS